MMVIRPVTEADYDGLRALGRETGPGFTSLQDNDQQVRHKLERGVHAFSQPKPPKESLFLFVLEDTDTDEIVGVCGVEGAVGLSEPWYNYRVGLVVHASRELNVYNQFHTLTMTNDHTGCSELCTLFLRPNARVGKNGALLSKCRFLFMAEFPQLFSDRLIAEMRGFSDETGLSPFWEGLGRHFFSMDFDTADQFSAMNKVFIAELMPSNAIYTQLLPKDAQDAIGKTHPLTSPARHMLENEGMRYTGYVDIFDAGPTLEARVNDIRAIRKSQYVKVQIQGPGDDVWGENEPDNDQFLLSNTRFQDFRCVATTLHKISRNLITITPEVAAALNIDDGATVRLVPLSSKRRF
jgi:arginine N-succinyltransferase